MVDEDAQKARDDVPADGPDGRAPRRRLWAAAAFALGIGFVAVVVGSIKLVPAPGKIGTGMSGMQMSAPPGQHPVALVARSFDGRPVRIPDGRPGVAVFLPATKCAACASTVETAVRSAQRELPQGRILVVVGVPLDGNRKGHAPRGRLGVAGGPAATYIADAGGRVASAFRVTSGLEAAVYDARVGL